MSKTLTAGNKEARRHNPRMRRAVVATLALACLIAALLAAGFSYLYTLPGVNDAEIRVHGILASHGAPASNPPLPAKLADAVVAVEDENFYGNFVLNFASGVIRVGAASVAGQGDPGGATIDQQLAKLLYTRGRRGAGTEMEQVGLAFKLDFRYSKVQILEMYLNAAYYGNGYWGDLSAAQGYFGTPPRHLTWAEASMLAGLLAAPSAYDPVRNLAAAKARQHHVLDQLVANGRMSKARARTVYGQPLPLRHR